MTHSRTSFYILIFVLLAAGSTFTVYRHINFDVPWTPGVKRQIWSIEAKVEFIADNQPVKLSLAIPDSQAGYQRISEHTASPGYGLAYIERNGARRAEWSIRRASGRQTLYYRVDMLVDHSANATASLPPALPLISPQQFGPYATSAQQMLQSAVERSADAYTLTRELINEFNAEEESAQFLIQKQTRMEWLLDLLQQARIPARGVLILALEDGRRQQTLQPYLQVFDGQNYRIFDPNTGLQLEQKDHLMWEYHSGALLDLVGGSQSSVLFSVIDQDVPARYVVEQDIYADKLIDFSIHSLPVGEQALFKGILLVPVGVLVVVFMRVFVGLRTTGTFMPVLIAIAFIQTSLVPGIIGFVLIVATGLVIRSYLSHLNLLLVARISAVIISVIIIIAVFAVLAFLLGLSEGLKITFFPMIILSWTIERMSILWEEEGPQEVLIQSGGSLATATIAYGLMMNDIIRHLTFNFLGLQLIFMALALMLGSYTGYRLLEIRRFRFLVANGSNK